LGKMRRLVCFLCMAVELGYAAAPLLEDYSRARELAVTYDRPLLLLFTGSDWSAPSQKMVQCTEMLDNQFIIVQVDFPEQNRKSGAVLLQNEILREKYGIKEFPLLVMLDSQEREITRVSYIEKEAGEYALYLKNLFFAYAQIKAAMERDLSLEELEELYEQATTLGCRYVKEELVKEGVKHKEGIFFPLEAYAHYVREGEHALPEAQNLRTLIIERDQQNEKKGRLRLALLDFQAHQDNSEEAVKFLQSYSENFGKEDLQQLLRLHGLIAEYFGGFGEVGQINRSGD
jgi:hypothetical protein